MQHGDSAALELGVLKGINKTQAFVVESASATKWTERWKGKAPTHHMACSTQEYVCDQQQHSFGDLNHGEREKSCN